MILIRIGTWVLGHITQLAQLAAHICPVSLAFSRKGQTCKGGGARAGKTCAGANSRAFILRGILLASGFNSLSFCRACWWRLEPRSLCFSSSLFFSSASRVKSRKFRVSRALSCVCLNSNHLIEVVGIPASRRCCVILLYASSSVSKRVVYCPGIDFAFVLGTLGPWGRLENAFTMGIGGAARKKFCGPTRLEDSQLRAWASTRTGVWRTRGCNRAL